MLEWVSGPLLHGVLWDSVHLSARPANMPPRLEMEPVIEARMGLRTPTCPSLVESRSYFVGVLNIVLV